MGRRLAQLGITPQKPLRRAYERDPETVEQWCRVDYPKLRRRAKRCGADIFLLDEAGIRSDAPLGRTWGAKGKTPLVATSGQRQSIQAISAHSKHTIVAQGADMSPRRRFDGKLGDELTLYLEYSTAGAFRPELAKKVIRSLDENARKGYSNSGRAPYGFKRHVYYEASGEVDPALRANVDETVACR